MQEGFEAASMRVVRVSGIRIDGRVPKFVCKWQIGASSARKVPVAYIKLFGSLLRVVQWDGWLLGHAAGVRCHSSFNSEFDHSQTDWLEGACDAVRRSWIHDIGCSYAVSRIRAARKFRVAARHLRVPWCEPCPAFHS